MNSQGANTAGIHDTVYTADALARLNGLDSILLEKRCFLNVQGFTSSESVQTGDWQNIKILELEIGQLIVKFGGGGWVAMLCSMWGLSSPTRDQTHTPCTGSTEF